MLTKSDNEKLTRVGPGTPAGDLLRRYWIPCALSTELPAPDCPPIRIRLLCENLIAFRTSSGEAALVDAYCPHRRAPLFFGRNEDDGIRCVYHGWKFDRTGRCVDMPSETIGSKLTSRVSIKSYPCFERGGIIWTYMGPEESMPQPPDYEWMRAPRSYRYVTKTFQACNYLQGLEGGLDTAHSSYAHNNNINSRAEMRLRDRSPRLDVERTEYGYRYVSFRNLMNGKYYVRIYHYAMPFQAFRGGIHNFDGTVRECPELNGHIWAPIDDETTCVYNWACSYDQRVPFAPAWIEQMESFYGRGQGDYIPGTFRLKASKENNYFIDREVQRAQTYTGIRGVNTQDFAIQEGMGPIVDRSLEHLATSDKAIVQMRRLLLDATRDVADGKMPRGSDPSSHRQIRPYDGFISEGEDWAAVLGNEIIAKW
jgi:phthalate 4,5-dioxygenase